MLCANFLLKFTWWFWRRRWTCEQVTDRRAYWQTDGQTDDGQRAISLGEEKHRMTRYYYVCMYMLYVCKLMVILWLNLKVCLKICLITYHKVKLPTSFPFSSSVCLSELPSLCIITLFKRVLIWIPTGKLIYVEGWRKY